MLLYVSEDTGPLPGRFEKSIETLRKLATAFDAMEAFMHQ